MHYYNVHTHFRAAGEQERILRNAYLYADRVADPGYALSAGIHPWYIGGSLSGARDRLRKALARPFVKALGECGLDRLKGPPLPVQYTWLEMQKELAAETGKPLIIHAVKSLEDIWHILRDSSVPVILHNFRAGKAQARKLAGEPVFYFSLGRGLLNGADKHMEAYRLLPRNRVLFETDTMSIPVQHIYARYAGLCGEETTRLAADTEQVVHEIWPAGF